MPRTSENAQILEDIDAAIEMTACFYLLASDEEEEEIAEDHIQDLLAIREIIAAHRYLSHDTSTSRYDIDILDAYIYEYPETAFLGLFQKREQGLNLNVELVYLLERLAQRVFERSAQRVFPRLVVLPRLAVLAQQIFDSTLRAWRVFEV
ncbi:hypothetical protein EV426DRAFT_708869 [Tirmania nivea]|nr:hypothetical protein EV426DRAFT_708869 [Tirmania nivea]